MPGLIPGNPYQWSQSQTKGAGHMGFQPHLRHVISVAIITGGPSYLSLTETHDIVSNPRPPPFITYANHRLFVVGGFDRFVPDLIEGENNAL